MNSVLQQRQRTPRGRSPANPHPQTRQSDEVSLAAEVSLACAMNSATCVEYLTRALSWGS